MVQPSALLSVGEVASRLGVCNATVYTLCGELRHIRILGALRFALADVEAFIAAHHRGCVSS